MRQTPRERAPVRVQELPGKTRRGAGKKPTSICHTLRLPCIPSLGEVDVEILGKIRVYRPSTLLNRPTVSEQEAAVVEISGGEKAARKNRVRNFNATTARFRWLLPVRAPTLPMKRTKKVEGQDYETGTDGETSLT